MKNFRWSFAYLDKNFENLAKTMENYGSINSKNYCTTVQNIVLHV